MASVFSLSSLRLLCALGCVLGVGACRDRGRRPPGRAGRAAAAAGPVVVRCPDEGCASDASGTPKPGGTLRVHVEAEPAALCDLIEHDAWSRWIAENQVAETLLEQDPFTGALAPRLAERWESTEGELTLHLRKGVRWHDGEPFSSADVVTTLAYVRDPKLGADQRADLDPVTAIETPDAHTVVLRLSRPAPFLRQALAHLSILPAHRLKGVDLRKSPLVRAPLGTGPFRFVRWRAGEELVIERNPSYWGPRAHLQQIVFRFVRDRQVAYELYRRGELDLMWRLPPGRAAEARGDARLAGHRMLLWTPRAYLFIVWNVRRGPLADPRVRRALAHLIDRDRFDQIGFAGQARRVTGPYPPGAASYDRSLAAHRFDPKEARRLLDEAGVKTLKLRFLVTAGSRTVEQLGTLLKEDLARAGVSLELASLDFAVQLDRLRRHAFDLSSLQWTMSLEQDNYSLFHSSQAARGQNYGGFADPEVDALLEQIRGTAEDAARHALERRLHGLIHERQPYAFLSSPEVQTLVAPRVHGLVPSTDGFSFSRAWVEPR